MPRENFSQQGICKRAIARILKRREKPAVFVFDRNQRLNGNRAARRLFLARPEHCPSTMDKRYIGCQKTHFHGHTDSDQPRTFQDTLKERTVSLRDLAAPTRV